MLNRLMVKVTKFQLLPPKRLGTVVKNILGGHHALPPPPCQIGLIKRVRFENVSNSPVQLQHFQILRAQSIRNCI